MTKMNSITRYLKSILFASPLSIGIEDFKYRLSDKVFQATLRPSAKSRFRTLSRNKETGLLARPEIIVANQK